MRHGNDVTMAATATRLQPALAAVCQGGMAHSQNHTRLLRSELQMPGPFVEWMKGSNWSCESHRCALPKEISSVLAKLMRRLCFSEVTVQVRNRADALASPAEKIIRGL